MKQQLQQHVDKTSINKTVFNLTLNVKNIRLEVVLDV